MKAVQLDSAGSSLLLSIATILHPALLVRPTVLPCNRSAWRRYMLASLREAALAAGHPEWGHGGPHDSGHYNSHSSETGFFKSYGGSWDTGAWWGFQLSTAAAVPLGAVHAAMHAASIHLLLPRCLTQLRSAAAAAEYGRFFLDWYSGLLIQHADRLLGAARQVRSAAGMPAGLLCCCCCAGRQAGRGPCMCSLRCNWTWFSYRAVMVHASSCLPTCPLLQVLSARCRPRTMREARELSDGGMLYVFEPAVQLGIKLAGVHWCAGSPGLLSCCG